jgi:DNA polymerase III delta subunit
LYIDGPEEPLKAALLGDLRHAWSRACPEAPTARVLRAAESSVEEILAAYHAGSLFTPRELVVVLEVEDLGRGERRIAALAEGLSRRAGASTLVLVEGAAETPRKSLEPLRAACQTRWSALPLARAELLEWGARRLRRRQASAERRVLERVADACADDPAAFFDELDKLATCTGAGGQVTEADVATLLRPMLGSGLPEYLSAVALGRPALAAQRLGGMLASGVREGAILFALGNLVGGALGGWARYREASDALRRRGTPGELAWVLDALYRAEAAWKRGRADTVAVLGHVTRIAAGAGVDRSRSA